MRGHREEKRKDEKCRGDGKNWWSEKEDETDAEGVERVVVR